MKKKWHCIEVPKKIKLIEKLEYKMEVIWDQNK